jgi:hypothetical protein
MKRLTRNCMLAAAALTAAAAGASAQSMKADIPFAFHAGNSLMAPGVYDVKLELNSRYVSLRHTDTGKAVIAMYISEAHPLAKWQAEKRPRIRFDCAGARCVLRQMWPGADNRALSFHGPGAGREEPIRSAEVPLTKVKIR